jgi:hypothetical protein
MFLFFAIIIIFAVFIRIIWSGNQIENEEIINEIGEFKTIHDYNLL